MSKADDKELDSLHGALAQALAKHIREGEPVLDKDNDPILLNGKELRKISPATLSGARHFLKEHHIESGVGNKDTSALQQAMDDMKNMPFTGEVPAEFKQ